MSPKALLALVVIACGAGCSLVSGWSDLQDGTGDDGGSSTPGKDSGGSSSADGASGSGSGSGSSGGDGSGSSSGGDTGTVQGPCANLHCASGDSCCIEPAPFGVHCQQQPQCAVTGGVFLACTDSRDCGGQLCCLPHDKSAAACGATCAAPDQVVCDPSSPSCGSGQSCVQSTGSGPASFANVYVCQ